ncbi:hypothetical protein IFM89_010061 [Coptis chinensis]|uniref:Large ribosomal subunit protein bL9c n=1 Tax=Coptis chinensis TaxID=261450 RepID=A0A835HH64_9MAGN|nr:hypothetical protein IFM89_010061 [Coptis chinensis]
MANLKTGTRNVLRQLIKTHNNIQTQDSITHPFYNLGQGLRYKHKKLEVILTTSIDKLGKAGETVKVAPGYFRNYLMPNILAVPNIAKYDFIMREQRKLYQREEVEVVKEVPQAKQDTIKEFEQAANRLEKANLVLRRMVKSSSDLNELRSPVTKEELVAEVSRQLCVNIGPENLHLPSSISSFGQYDIQLLFPKAIRLPEGKVKWTLNVKIRRK